MCQWRKSLFWKAMMYQTYDQIKELYPTHRWLFLTLTVENCPIGELRATLSHMNDAWKKLTKRKEFALVDGWIRTTEVTRDKERPN
ncbi:protein rep, partial [Pseudomonas viridiflava]|uniref:protein rep n=1 Tax=Pseudomonas viridiflava TaxID=33069 RepID=UPI0019813E7D